MSREEPTQTDATMPVDAEVVDDTSAPASPPPAVPPEETVDGVPVLAEVRALDPAPAPLPAVQAALPAVQAAAAAATGFVAGAATLALVRRHSARKVARARQQRRTVDGLPIIGSRSFLVDVHLIAKPGE